jgi:hypothetical protein
LAGHIHADFDRRGGPERQGGAGRAARHPGRRRGRDAARTLSGAKQSFLASIGIRHLVTATKTLARKGGQLILIGSQDPIREVLTTAGLASMMAMVASETEARAMLAR